MCHFLPINMSKRIEEKEEYQRVIVTTEAKKTPDSYFPKEDH
jgi:hypothetical protein